MLQPNDPDPTSAELAVCPGARSAMVYLLGDEDRAERLRRARAARGCESSRASTLLAWREDGEACVWTARGELRFAPGQRRARPPRRDAGTSTASLDDARGSSAATASWRQPRLPGCARRLWAALACAGAGDVLVSAARGLRVRRLGRRRPRRRRQPRLAAPRRLARRRSAFVNCGPDLGRRRVARAAPVVDRRRRAGRAGPLRRRRRDAPTSVDRDADGCRACSSGTRCAARRAEGVAGWVRNCPDGAVEAVFEGEPDAVERLVDLCRIGPAPRAWMVVRSIEDDARRGRSIDSGSAERTAPETRAAAGHYRRTPRCRATWPPAARRAGTMPAACGRGLRKPATGCSWSSSRSSARAATSSTWPSTRPWSRSPACTTSAAALAFCVAVTNNFLWNRHWTFQATDGHAGFQAARFLTVSLLALGFNLIVLELLVSVGDMREDPRAGDRDPRRDAAQLRRQQALELRQADSPAPRRRRLSRSMRRLARAAGARARPCSCWSPCRPPPRARRSSRSDRSRSRLRRRSRRPSTSSTRSRRPASRRARRSSQEELSRHDTRARIERSRRARAAGR